MNLHQNVLLTHVGEPWLGEAVYFGVGLLSKTIGNIQLLPEIVINNTMANSSMMNPKLNRGKRADKARSLGWTLWLSNEVLSRIASKGIAADPYAFGAQCWSSSTSVSRRLFDDLCVWSSGMAVSSDRIGLGGVHRRVHGLLSKEVYGPLKIAMPSYNTRDRYWCLVDTVITVALCQYINWANGLAHTYDNLLGCYLYINGYATKYRFLTNSWMSVDQNVVKRKLNVTKIDDDRPVANFTWKELLHSGTAVRLGLPNVPTATHRKNLLEQAKLLQVIRDWYGRPMTINSGYRSPKVNEKAGGVAGSAHQVGRASDIQFSGSNPGKSNQLSLARSIGTMLRQKGVKFDQIIAYNNFIHVSVRRPNGSQRCEVFADGQYSSTRRVYA